jgi:predicted nucleic acid-binding protein
MPVTQRRFLLDTNVVSELARTSPAPAVVGWLSTQRSVCVSSVTVFELSAEIERLRAGNRRSFLEAWLAELLAEAVEVLPFDQDAALSASRLEARARSNGRAIEVRDLIIVATADAAGLTLATHNVEHFSGLGVLVVDPFAGIRRS